MISKHKASRIYRIRLNRGGYTTSGEYYGVGQPLYVVVITYKTMRYDGRSDLGDHWFAFRAPDYATAKARVQAALTAKPSSYQIQQALNGFNFAKQ